VILGLDIGTQAIGWAYGHAGCLTDSGAEKFCGDPDLRFYSARVYIEYLLDYLNPEQVLVEMTIGKFRTELTLAALQKVTGLACRLRGIEFLIASVPDVRRSLGLRKHHQKAVVTSALVIHHHLAEHMQDAEKMALLLECMEENDRYPKLSKAKGKIGRPLSDTITQEGKKEVAKMETIVEARTGITNDEGDALALWTWAAAGSPEDPDYEPVDLLAGIC